jgi:hypothetical protein
MMMMMTTLTTVLLLKNQLGEKLTRALLFVFMFGSDMEAEKSNTYTIFTARV